MPPSEPTGRAELLHFGEPWEGTMEATCETCRFLDGRLPQCDSEGVISYACRRHPPVPFLDGEETTTILPFVEPSDWCGEHQPKNQAKPTNASLGLPEIVHRNSLSVRTRKIVLRRLGLPLETQGIDAAAVRSISYTEWREQSRCGPLVLQELQKVFGVGCPAGEHQPRETEPLDAQ